MTRTIVILGSTGSIGENTLQVLRNHPGRFKVAALAARKNADKLIAQAKEFKPSIVCVYENAAALKVQKALLPLKIKVVTGDEGLEEISILKSAEIILCAMVGACGLKPLLSAIRAGKHVAVANKEPLVMAGPLLMKEAAQKNVKILPVDSEHSGLWQCLESKKAESIKKLIVTSSGGPFRTYKKTLRNVTPAQALKHPRWKMGAKISIDSATLMNKGLEVIEAANLFKVSVDKIDVLIHPEAVIHALVEFVDGSQMAHLGVTDMRLPIQYALSYPDRLMNHLPVLDLIRVGKFHFEKPDYKRFPCLELGYEAGRKGGTFPTVLNAANEIAVGAFLEQKILFTDIPKIIEKIVSKHKGTASPSLEEILACDDWARKEVEDLL